MTTRRCTHCGEGLPGTLRADAKYCDGACRVAALRDRRRAKTARPTSPSRTPELQPEYPRELTTLSRWVRRNNDKLPLTTSGQCASSTDPTTWATYDDAASSAVGTGLGFVLVGDGIGCIDLDHVIDADGTLSADATRILADCPDTYVEVSMSGDGLHVFGRGIHVSSRKLRGKTQGEVIGSKKYVAVTGRRYNDAPLKLGKIGDVAGRLMNERG